MGDEESEIADELLRLAAFRFAKAHLGLCVECRAKLPVFFPLPRDGRCKACQQPGDSAAVTDASRNDEPENGAVDGGIDFEDQAITISAMIDDAIDTDDHPFDTMTLARNILARVKTDLSRDREQIARALFASYWPDRSKQWIDEHWATDSEARRCEYIRADVVLALRPEGPRDPVNDGVETWGALYDAFGVFLRERGFDSQGASWNADDLAKLAIRTLRARPERPVLSDAAIEIEVAKFDAWSDRERWVLQRGMKLARYIMNGGKP